MIEYVGISICLITLLMSLSNKMIIMGVPEWLEEVSQNSTLFEDYYVDPENVTIDFPARKRNLLLIYMESMEATYASMEAGGAKEINYIPELTKLANDNINFSDNDKLGGAHNYAGGWTMAGLLASSSGYLINCLLKEIAAGTMKHFCRGLLPLAKS